MKLFHHTVGKEREREFEFKQPKKRGIGRKRLLQFGLMGTGYLAYESSVAPVLRMVFPPAIQNPETDIHAKDKIYITKEQLYNGVQLVTIGDSISRGFQGYWSDVQRPSTENPPTPATKEIVDRLAFNGIHWPEPKIYAEPGETSSQIVEQVKRFILDAKKEVAEARRRGKVPMPYIVELGEHGNDYREIISNISNFESVKQIKENGIFNFDSLLDILAVYPAFQQTTATIRDNALLCLNLLAQAKQDGIPIIGVWQRLPYPFDNIPKVEFMPTPARNKHEEDLRRKNGVDTQDFYPTKDPIVQLGMHDVSYYAYAAVKEARKQFDMMGPSPFPVPLVSTVGIESLNNGTEHLSPIGNQKVGEREMKHTAVKGMGRTLASIAPKLPPSSI
jgi:hypothetical protein